MTTTETADVRAQLAERELAVTRLRGELDQIEEAIEDIAAARVVGDKIDPKRLVELGSKRDALTAEIASEESAVSGLRRRINAFDAAVAQRRHAELLGQMEALSAEAIAREAEYEATALKLISLAGEMAAAAWRFSTLDSEAGRLEQRFGVARAVRRAPFRGIPIPESFLIAPNRAKDFPAYLAGKIATRRGWAGKLPKASPPPVEASTVKKAFRVLRDLVIPADQGLHETLPAGSTQELAADRAAWIERDQPGTLAPVSAE